jgi:hypothetical protein
MSRMIPPAQQVPCANQASTFAERATEYEEDSLIPQAIECHFRAAEMYLLAINDTSDQQTVKVSYRITQRLSSYCTQTIPGKPRN